MTQYDIVFFDADGTLFDFPKAQHQAFFRTMEQYGLSASEEAYHTYTSVSNQLWALLEQGGITQAELTVERFRRFFRLLGIRRDPAAFNEDYLSNLGDGSFLYEQSEELCRRLYPHAKLYITTNGITLAQRKRLALSAIRPYIADIFISQELGLHKPQAEYFDAVFARLGEPDRSRAIILGDSLTSDMQGGVNAGIATCWYNPEGIECARPELCRYQVRRLLDFVPMVLGE